MHHWCDVTIEDAVSLDVKHTTVTNPQRWRKVSNPSLTSQGRATHAVWHRKEVVFEWQATSVSLSSGAVSVRSNVSR